MIDTIIILCGGQGSRMGKKGLRIPKPLQKVGTKSILEHKIRYYYDQGIKKIILAVGFRSNVIKKMICEIDLPTDLDIDFSDAGENAGILKRIKSASRSFIDKSVCFSYGDTFTNIDLNKLNRIHLNSDNEATIVVSPFKNPFGLIEFDSKYKIKSYKEKPVLNYYIGYAIINLSFIQKIDDDVINMEDGNGIIHTYETLTHMNKLGAYYHKDLHITFNTPYELEVAKKEIIKFYTMKEE